MKPNIGRRINRVVVEVPGHQQGRWIGKKVECDCAGLGIPAAPEDAKRITVLAFETSASPLRAPKRHDVFHA